MPEVACTVLYGQYRLSNALYSVGLDQHSTGNISVPLCYQSLARDHVFPPRKAHHPMKAGSGQPMEGYTARGILKTHWPQKHTQQVNFSTFTL